MPKLQDFLRRPRYLRAIPSLMLLTTAMAWGVTPDADVQDDFHRRSSSASVARADLQPLAPSSLPPAKG